MYKLFSFFCLERCHGRLDAYVGNVSWTISNKTCHKWSDTCSDTTLIDLNNMDGINTNYCRNPNGYRKTPWCYTDRTTKNWEYCNIPHCPGKYYTWQVSGHPFYIAYISGPFSRPLHFWIMRCYVCFFIWSERYQFVNKNTIFLCRCRWKLWWLVHLYKLFMYQCDKI